MLGFLYKYLFKPTVPVIHLHGAITQQSANAIQRALDRINPHRAKALAVVVNSPGGLPVQSDIICAKVKAYAKRHHIPLYTFGEDLAASGGYFVLCVGDRVFVDQSTLVGSIGVIGGWFGLKRWLVRYGIENRRFSSNQYQTSTTTYNSLQYQLDVFEDYNEEGVRQTKELLSRTHLDFINHVESHRGSKIKVPEAEKQARIYNADVFTGNEAVELGLVDGVGLYQDILTQHFPGTKLVHVSTKSQWQLLQQWVVSVQSFKWDLRHLLQ